MQDRYILTALAGVIAALLIGRWYKQIGGAVTFLDSIAMSLFAVALCAVLIDLIHMTSVRFRIHLKPALSGLDDENFEGPKGER